MYFIEEVAKKSKVISDAEKADVHVIDEGFLEAVKRGGAALLISSHSIASWGSDVSYFVIEFIVYELQLENLGLSGFA